MQMNFLVSRYNYLVIFKTRNKLERPAHSQKPKLFVVGIILIILVLLRFLIIISKAVYAYVIIMKMKHMRVFKACAH